MLHVAAVGPSTLAGRLRAWAPCLTGLRISDASADDLTDPGAAPDVVIVGRVPDVPGHVRGLREANLRVLVVRPNASPAFSTTVLDTGACLLVGTDEAQSALADAICSASLGPGPGPGGDPVVPVTGPGQVPRLSARELVVLRAYVSGLTLEAVAHLVGIKPNTAKTYLRRAKEKYQRLGRPAYTKLDLALRVHEDRIDGQRPADDHSAGP